MPSAPATNKNAVEAMTYCRTSLSTRRSSMTLTPMRPVSAAAPLSISA
jgi:hypothetical protein